MKNGFESSRDWILIVVKKKKKRNGKKKADFFHRRVDDFDSEEGDSLSEL